MRQENPMTGNIADDVAIMTNRELTNVIMPKICGLLEEISRKLDQLLEKEK